jgi:hypothetical protein
MKRTISGAAAAVFVSIAGWDAAEFASGYFGSVGASLLLFGLAGIATLVAVVVFFMALFRRDILSAAILVVVLMLSWLLSPWYFARTAFLRGFAAHVRRVTTLAEIEAASQTCLTLLPNGGRVYGPKKVAGPRRGEEEENKRLWEAIKRYPFVHYMNDKCVIFVDLPNTTFSWGGALAGHWGIEVKPVTDDTPLSGPFETMKLSERIILFRGE